MTTDYDLSTSYKSDFELADFVEDVTWEKSADNKVTGLRGHWVQVRQSDMSSGAGVGFVTNTVPVVVWQPEPSIGAVAQVFTPQPGHILRRTEKANEGWVVLDVDTNDLGHWVCNCEREVTNG